MYNSYTCSCSGGYRDVDENAQPGTDCINIDECGEGSHDCDSNALCTDTVGSFTCECLAGYEGSGQNCIDAQECNEMRSRGSSYSGDWQGTIYRVLTASSYTYQDCHDFAYCDEVCQTAAA